MANPYSSQWGQYNVQQASFENGVGYQQTGGERSRQSSYSYQYQQQTPFTPPAAYPSSSPGYPSNISPPGAGQSPYTHSPLLAAPQPAVTGGYPSHMPSSYSRSSFASPSSISSETPYRGGPPPAMPQQSSGYLTAPTSVPHSLQPAAQLSGVDFETPSSKRFRGMDDIESPMEQDFDASLDAKERMKPIGACTRCKSLKVKCEFKTDYDPCKRCLNGGHDCVIPGRKKRRVPPKREFLLSQIREQATEIEKLMARLDQAQQGTQDAPLKPSSATESVSPDIDNSKAVEDWLAKARDSLAEFGGYIGVGVPKSYIVDHDPEDSPTSDEDESDGKENEKRAQHDAALDPELVHGSRNEGEQKTVRKYSSTSSIGSGPKRREPDKSLTLPSEAVPFGLMAGLSLRKVKETDDYDGDESTRLMGVGVASDDFFRLSPDASRLPAAQTGPNILTRGLITPSEAESLFKIYFDCMNLSVSLVDPVLYTAQSTLYRSPFLFTVICAIASRFYKERPGIYPEAMSCAQLAAGNVLIGGPKNIEVVMGLILLSLYPVPSRRWDEERGWIFLGLAIRFAVDLNLHLPNTAKPQNEMHARELLNRTRIWLNCFNLDRSTGSQYGKAPIISNMDYLANHSEHWWQSSPYNLLNFDIHLCCYNAELKTMSAFRAKIYSDPNHPTGLNKDVNLELLAIETDEELQQLARKWFAYLEQTDQEDPQNRFRTGLLKLAFSYARLICLSFGFQHAFGKSHANENPFFLRCLSAASDVVTAMVHDIGRPSQRVYLLHGPEAQSVFTTFAAAFLIKLLQPKFVNYLPADKREEIVKLIQSVIDLLSSPDVALDDRHGPKLYARFLKGLLNAPLAGGTSRSRSAKSSSSQPHGSQRSPSTSSTSLSPPPSQASMSFDQFAPAGGAVDPFTAPVQSEYIPSPLTFGQGTLPNMQTITDSSAWQTTNIPGYGWMGEYNSGMQGPSASKQMYNNYPQ